MKMTMRLVHKQEQRHGLHAIIESSAAMGVPHQVFEGVLDAIVRDPGSADSKLRGLKRSDGLSEGRGTRAFFPAERGAGEDESAYQGTIVFPSLKLFADMVPDKTITIEPDVTYHSTDDKPQVHFASYLIGEHSLRLDQIPTQFREARQFYERLALHIDWLYRTLRKFYVTLGEAQREAIRTQRLTSLHTYDLVDAADALDLGQSTVSRLRLKRTVAIAQDETLTRIPVRLLMPTAHLLKRYAAMDGLNDVLEGERNGEALSDQDIVKTAKGSRRLITKIREMYAVPNSRIRQVAYETNTTTVFRVPSTLAELANAEIARTYQSLPAEALQS